LAGCWSRLARSSVFAVAAAIVVLVVVAVGFMLSLVGPLLVHEGVRYWQAGTCRTDMRDGCRARVPAVVTSVDTSDGFCSVSLQAGDEAFTNDLEQCPAGGFERGAGCDSGSLGRHCHHDHARGRVKTAGDNKPATFDSH
jgi:hypothetical protein